MVLRDQGASRRAALRPRHRRCCPAGFDHDVESARVERRRRRGRCFVACRRGARVHADAARQLRAGRAGEAVSGRLALPLARGHRLGRARLHPLPGAGADGGARERNAAEGKLMPGFDDTRRELASWRAERKQADDALLLAREAVRRGKRGAEGRVRELEQTVKSLDAHGAGLWESFGEFARPRDALRRLPDRHPILLFPLRLETRFKTVDGQAQLWVRVYPDQCLAESFEATLTEAEARNAQIFWAGIWRAGGVDAEERAAWRDLASAHGVGRASWIVKHHLPLNTADQPQRTKPSDVLLVIVATADAPAKTAEFWEKVWRAGGTEAAIVAARPALEAQVGAATAKLIVEEFTPINLGQPPGAGETR